jgi:hypothetical protein
VADGLMTALDLQKPLVNDLHGQGAQMVLTLKMTYVLKNVNISKRFIKSAN